MDTHFDLGLIDRYLSNECSIEERAAIEQWLAADRRRSLAMLRDGTLYPAGLGDVERMIERFRARDADLPARRSHRARTWPLHALQRWPVVGAALFGVVCLIAGAEGLLHWRNSTRSAPTTRVYTTTAGQRAHVTLADGSQVTLAPQTTLTIRGDLRAPGINDARTITLVGEAYFAIVNSRAPFLVQAGATTTRVLGTRFDVRRYQSDSVVTVIVRDGRVALAASNAARGGTTTRTTVLSSNMMAQAGDSGDITTHSRVAIDDALAWTQGRLVFDGESLGAAVPELERAYDIDIRVPDSTLARRQFTLVMTIAPSSANAMLDALSATVGACYTRAGRVVTFSPSRSACTHGTVHPLFTPEVRYGR